MKEIKLKKLILQNWRGRNLVISFKLDGVTNIMGRNKSGKSSLKDAFLWLMTGFDSSNRANYNLFDNNHNYTAEDSPVASVEALIAIDGNEFYFKKEAKKGWIRRRGNKEYELKGSDDYVCYFDGIEVSAGEYKKRVSELLCEIEPLKVMLNTEYFLSLEWKQQREMLSLLAGDIQESDFKSNYSDLFLLLKKYSIDELKAQVKTKISPMKQQLSSFPLTIQTLEQHLPDISNVYELEKEIGELKSKIVEIDNAILSASKMAEPYIEMRNKQLQELSNINSEIRNKKSDFEYNQNEKPNKIRRQIQEAKKENEYIQRQRDKAQEERKYNETKLARLKAKVEEHDEYRKKLLNEKDELLKSEFNNETCSFCGQDLPESMLEANRKDFYKKRENAVNDIIKKGKENNERKQEKLEEIERIEALLAEDIESPMCIDIEELEKELQKAEQETLKFEDSNEYKKLKDKADAIQNGLTEVPVVDNTNLLNMKESLTLQIEEKSRAVGLVDERKRQLKTIASLKREMREVADSLAVQEQIEANIKSYEEERAQIVSNRVNKYFSRCNISMMQQDKSGQWIPSCTITVSDGSLVSTCNGAENILVGLDISNAFASYYDISLPVFVDDVNLINSDVNIETNHQLIKLIVSEDENIIVR